MLVDGVVLVGPGGRDTYVGAGRSAAHLAFDLTGLIHSIRGGGEPTLRFFCPLAFRLSQFQDRPRLLVSTGDTSASGSNTHVRVHMHIHAYARTYTNIHLHKTCTQKHQPMRRLHLIHCLGCLLVIGLRFHAHRVLLPLRPSLLLLAAHLSLPLTGGGSG